jgi:hypothetical protein
MQLPTNTPQYFFDETWIASSRYLKRRWLSTNVHPDPALVPDRPWEANELVLFGTVVRHGDEWWMYYSRRDSTNHMVMLLATSTDGIRWWKPELGIVEWGGSTANNIVLNPPRKADSFSVVFDDRDAEFPWKCLGSMPAITNPAGVCSRGKVATDSDGRSSRGGACPPATERTPCSSAWTESSSRGRGTPT